VRRDDVEQLFLLDVLFLLWLFFEQRWCRPGCGRGR